MATTFQAEVEALTNVTIGGAGAPTDTQVDTWCTEGAKDIIRRVKTSDPSTMALYASSLLLVDEIPETRTSVAVAGYGVGLPYMFTSVAHNWTTGMWVKMVNCTGALYQLEGIIAQVYDMSADVIQLYGVVQGQNYTVPETCDIIAPDDVQLQNVEIPSGILLDVQRSLIQHATLVRKTAEEIDEREYYMSDEKDGLHYRSKFNPGYYYDGRRIYFAPPLSSLDGEAGYVRTVQYPEIDSATDNIGELTDFDPARQYLISTFGAIKTLEFMIATVDPSSTLNAFSPQLSIPSAPAVPTYAFSDAALTADPGSLLGVGSIGGTAPEYNSGVVVGFSTALQDFATFHSSAFTMDLGALASLATVGVAEPSGSLSAPTVGAMSSSATASDIVTKVDALAPPTYSPQSGIIPGWTFNDEPDFSALTLPTSNLNTLLTTLTGSQLAYGNQIVALVIPTPWSEQEEDQVDPAASTPGYEETIGVSWDAVNEALDNEDFEEASAHLTKMTTRVANQQQMFTQQMEEYGTKFAEIEKGAEFTNNMQWERTLAAWKDEVEFYKMQVQNVYTTYGHNLTRETSKWTNTATQNMTLFAQEMTDSLNSFNAENVAFEKDVEAIITDISNEIEVAAKNLDVEKEVAIQNSISSYKADLDQYMQDISNYGTSVTKYSRDVQFHVEKYSSEFQAYTDTWKARTQHLLEENKNLTAEALNLFNKENIAYQAAVTLSVAQFNSEAEALIKKMELSTDVDNQNKAKKLEGEIQQYNAIMDRYVGEIQSYQHEVNYEINIYAQEIAKSQFDQSAIQLGYTWYQDKYNRLVGEYEASFGAGASAPPQAAPQGA